MTTLTVIVLTLNESHNIVDCLKSVSFADEILVVDAKSTDNTQALAREFTNKIYTLPWEGCGPQRQKALALASSEWVLFLDADERVTPSLKNEILAVLPKTSANGFEIPFRSFYCGKAIRFGDWLKEKHLRLFRRNQAKIIPRLVHFGLEVQGKIEKLQGRILHYSFPNLEAVLRKINHYSSDGALHKLQQGKKAGLATALFRAFWTFIRGYLLKLGFLDGKEGFLLAISNAEGVYYRYLKLMYLEKQHVS